MPQLCKKTALYVCSKDQFSCFSTERDLRTEENSLSRLLRKGKNLSNYFHLKLLPSLFARNFQPLWFFLNFVQFIISLSVSEKEDFPSEIDVKIMDEGSYSVPGHNTKILEDETLSPAIFPLVRILPGASLKELVWENAKEFQL